jgi:hypothetical protein
MVLQVDPGFRRDDTYQAKHGAEVDRLSPG